MSQMTEAEFRALFDRLRALVPWGPDDRRGALNYLTPERVRSAATEVRQGRAISLAAHIGHRVTPDNPDPCRHEMTSEADECARGRSWVSQRFLISPRATAHAAP